MNLERMNLEPCYIVPVSIPGSSLDGCVTSAYLAEAGDLRAVAHCVTKPPQTAAKLTAILSRMGTAHALPEGCFHRLCKQGSPDNLWFADCKT